MPEVAARIAQRVAAWRSVRDVHLGDGAVTRHKLDASLVNLRVSRGALRNSARPHANRGVVSIDNDCLGTAWDVASKVVHLHVARFASGI
jgi:hypothetical protein